MSDFSQNGDIRNRIQDGNKFGWRDDKQGAL